ncbi:hypothetical protein Baya_12678 [Bagarius yarrelli]|uniref:Uncharacterized protein n=1 Tax=Bagarius yarrelli TaxID=175774 RepID=A0A556V3D9_BAGYA|nr:hypothetical protein Baya_12678 [Bagarius yarrelli]
MAYRRMAVDYKIISQRPLGLVRGLRFEARLWREWRTAISPLHWRKRRKEKEINPVTLATLASICEEQCSFVSLDQSGSTERRALGPNNAEFCLTGFHTHTLHPTDTPCPPSPPPSP